MSRWANKQVLRPGPGGAPGGYCVSLGCMRNPMWALLPSQTREPSQDVSHKWLTSSVLSPTCRARFSSYRTDSIYTGLWSPVPSPTCRARSRSYGTDSIYIAVTALILYVLIIGSWMEGSQRSHLHRLVTLFPRIFQTALEWYEHFSLPSIYRGSLESRESLHIGDFQIENTK